MTIELIPLCTVQGTLRDPFMIGDGPAGSRVIVEVSEMTLSGRLEATMVGVAGADWATVTGGIATLDVRATIKTHDDALIFVQYMGRMNTRGDSPGTLYVAPRFETGDERYSWLNAIQAVGKGQAVGTDLTYDWFELG